MIKSADADIENIISKIDKNPDNPGITASDIDKITPKFNEIEKRMYEEMDVFGIPKSAPLFYEESYTLDHIMREEYGIFPTLDEAKRYLKYEDYESAKGYLRNFVKNKNNDLKDSFFVGGTKRLVEDAYYYIDFTSLPISTLLLGSSVKGTNIVPHDMKKYKVKNLRQPYIHDYGPYYPTKYDATPLDIGIGENVELEYAVSGDNVFYFPLLPNEKPEVGLKRIINGKAFVWGSRFLLSPEAPPGGTLKEVEKETYHNVEILKYTYKFKVVERSHEKSKMVYFTIFEHCGKVEGGAWLSNGLQGQGALP